MATEPNTGLTVWPSGAIQQDLIFNSLLLFYAYSGYKASVKDKDLATPPASPSHGDAYIVASAPTGAWAGKSGMIAFWFNGSWNFFAPKEGYIVSVLDENADYRHDGLNWVIALTDSAGGVVGPASSADNTLPRFDGATGKVIQGSGVSVTDNNEISGYRGHINRQTGTAYTLQASDAGKIIELANAAAITLTLPNDLPQGFACTIVQDGAGQVTLSPASGATLKHRQSHTKTGGNGAWCGLYVSANGSGTSAGYLFGGDTAA